MIPKYSRSTAITPTSADRTASVHQTFQYPLFPFVMIVPGR